MDFVIKMFGLNETLQLSTESIINVFTVEPSNYTVDINALYKAVWFTISFDKEGQTETCKFQRTVLRELLKQLHVI